MTFFSLTKEGTLRLLTRFCALAALFGVQDFRTPEGTATAAPVTEVGLRPTVPFQLTPSVPPRATSVECLASAETHEPTLLRTPESYPPVVLDVVARKRSVVENSLTSYAYRVTANAAHPMGRRVAGTLTFWQPRVHAPAGWQATFGPQGEPGAETPLEVSDALPQAPGGQSTRSWQDLDDTLAGSGAAPIDPALPGVFLFRSTDGLHVLARLQARSEGCRVPLKRARTEVFLPLLSEESLPGLETPLAFLPIDTTRTQNDVRYDLVFPLGRETVRSTVHATFVPSTHSSALGHVVPVEATLSGLPSGATVRVAHTRLLNDGRSETRTVSEGVVGADGTLPVSLGGLEPSLPQAWGEGVDPYFMVVTLSVTPKDAQRPYAALVLMKSEQGRIGFTPTRGIIFPF